MIVYEISLIEKRGGQSIETKHTVLIFNSMFTVALVISVYIKYEVWLQWNKSLKFFTQFDNLISTGTWKEMVVELLICIIAPYPFLDGYKYTETITAYNGHVMEYEVNDILLFFSFFRFYMILNFVIYMT